MAVPDAGDDVSDEPRTCRQCAHCTRSRTCAEPAAAGLADRVPSGDDTAFLIVWPPAGHAVDCAAWTPRPPAGTA